MNCEISWGANNAGNNNFLKVSIKCWQSYLSVNVRLQSTGDVNDDRWIRNLKTNAIFLKQSSLELLHSLEAVQQKGRHILREAVLQYCQLHCSKNYTAQAPVAQIPE